MLRTTSPSPRGRPLCAGSRQPFRDLERCSSEARRNQGLPTQLLTIPTQTDAARQLPASCCSKACSIRHPCQRSRSAASTFSDVDACEMNRLWVVITALGLAAFVGIAFLPV